VAERKDLSELIARAWRTIDLAEERLNSPDLSEGEKIRWATVHANLIRTLSRLMAEAGVGRLEREDLATLLSRIPKRYRGLRVFSKWSRLVG